MSETEMSEEECSARDIDVARAETRQALRDTGITAVALGVVIAAAVWLCDAWPYLSVAMGDPTL